MCAPHGGLSAAAVPATDVWRYGNTFKSNGVDGPYALFQNTFLVYAQDGQASYLHYRNWADKHPRRSFNNIFVAVNPDADKSDKPITFLPSALFPGPTDGNLYHRLGWRRRPVPVSGLQSPRCQKPIGGAFDIQGGWPIAPRKRSSSMQSQDQYAPGYEAQGVAANPQFLRLGSGRPFPRFGQFGTSLMSPARAAGIALPPDLLELDSQVVAPTGDAPDIGAYPFGGESLAVGVDGRKSYPTSP